MMEVAPVNDTKPSQSQSQANINPKSERPPLGGGIQVNISIVDSPSSFKIEIGGFNNLNVTWLHSIMKTYENRLWMKVPTQNRTVYLCMHCRKGLYRFETIRNHLYKHLEIFPFKCCACEKSYTSSSGLYKHTKSKHGNLKARKWFCAEE